MINTNGFGIDERGGLLGDALTRSAAADTARRAVGTRRPRVGVDFHVWDGKFQGSRSHLFGLYSAAIPQAPHIDFVLMVGDPESLRRSDPVFSLPNVQLVHMPSRNGLWRLGFQLPALRLRHRLDLLHLQYRMPPLLSGACVCTVHDVLFETHRQFFPRLRGVSLRAFGWLAARNAQVLMTVSKYTRDSMRKVYGISDDRIFVTHNGVDRARFFPGNAGQEQLAGLGLQSGQYILTVGRLEPRKNHVGLIRAYARLPDDSPPLVIVGQRDFEYAAILKAIESAGCGDRIRLLENVQDSLLPVVMRHASLFVYPAFAEGFGMPVIEAMASGVPVITSNTTALRELAGDAALTVTPDSESELQEAMALLLSNPQMSRRLSDAGVERARTFDWGSSAAIMIDALDAGIRAQTRH
jgi:glycosyltransferase involved in cell wall biosynthesis